MKGKELVEAIKKKRLVLGTLVTSTSPLWAEVVKKTGLDFVFIDTEHISIDRGQLAWMCQLYKAEGLAPLVRVPVPLSYWVNMALDAGAEGVIAPYVESIEQVREVVGAVRFRPLKGVRLREVLEGRGELEGRLKDYLWERNEDKLTILNIESVPAVERLEEILSVPGIDALVIGPHDLSCSLGIPEDYDHPLFQQVVRTIIRKGREAGVAVGIHYPQDIEKLIRWVREGMSLLIYSSDREVFARKMMEDLRRLKSSIEEG